MERLLKNSRTAAFIFALAFTLSAVALLMILAPKGGDTNQSFLRVAIPPGWHEASAEPNAWLRSYLRLNNWDSLHFFDIAKNEYHMPSTPVQVVDIHEYRANAVYFPGYPILVRGVSQLAGFPMEYALLVVAQISALVFWFYFFLLGEICGLKRSTILLAALFIFIQPGAFYLVAGFSESLFLAGLLGYTYWTIRYFERRDFASLGLAAIHGFAMASSRIVGIPLAILPILYCYCVAKRRQFPRWDLWLLSAVSASGGLLFFLFCAKEFGDAGVYFHLQSLGWGTQANYLALFEPWTYLPRFFFEDTSQSIDRSCVLYLLGFFVLLAVRLKKHVRDPGFPILSTLSVLAFGLFYISVSGKGNTQMAGMMRYAFPIAALCTLPIFSTYTRQTMPRKSWIYFLGVVLFSTQIWSAFRFLRGRWVS